MLWRMCADTHQEVRHHGSAKFPSIRQSNGNNGSARPDSVDLAEAMALMADADDAGDDAAGETASADDDADDDASKPAAASSPT